MEPGTVTVDGERIQTPGSAGDVMDRRVRRSVRMGCSCTLAALVFTNACQGVDSRDSSPPEEGFRIQAEADTLPSGLVTIRNRMIPEGAGAVRWSAREDLRLGEGDDPAERFGYPVHVAPGSDGTVYVLNRGPEEIRVFREDGGSSRTIGLHRLEGREGPVWGLVPLEDGAVMLRDSGGYYFLSPEGSLLERTHAGFLPAREPYGGTRDASGDLVDWSFEEERRPDKAHGVWRYRPLRLSPGLAASDSLPPLELRVALAPGTPIPGPFNSRLMFDVDREGYVWWAESREYRVWRRTLDGDTVLAFTLDHDPVPVPEDRKARYAQAWSQVHEIRPEHVPDTEPVIARIVAGSEGMLFVFPNLRGQPAGSTVDVFRDGVFLGRIQLSTALSVTVRRPAIVGPWIYGVTEEGTGTGQEFHVVRLRIEGWDPDSLPSSAPLAR